MNLLAIFLHEHLVHDSCGTFDDSMIIANTANTIVIFLIVFISLLVNFILKKKKLALVAHRTPKE
jgi:hypothetical protein